MCRTQNPVAGRAAEKDSRSPRRFARPGATSIPIGFGLRLSFCRFCLERFQRPTVLITPIAAFRIAERLVKRKLIVRRVEKGEDNEVLMKQGALNVSEAKSVASESGRRTAALQDASRDLVLHPFRQVLDCGCPSAAFVSNALSDRKF